MSFNENLLQQSIKFVPQSNSFFYLNLNTHANALFAKKEKWTISQPLSQGLTKSKQNTSQNPSRSEICQWFLRLTEEELSAATIIDNTDFVERFIKYLPNFPKHKLIHFPSGKILPSVLEIKNSDNHFESILNLSKISWINQAQLYISGASGEKLLSWMNNLSGGKVFQPPIRSLNRDDPQSNLLWFSEGSFHTLECWFINELEKSILKYYYTSRSAYHRIVLLKEYIIKKKLGKNYLKCLETNIYEINAELNNFKKTQQGLKQIEEKMRQQIQDKLIHDEEQISKKKRRRKKNKREVVENDNKTCALTAVDEQVQQMQDLQKQIEVEQLLTTENFDKNDLTQIMVSTSCTLDQTQIKLSSKSSNCDEINNLEENKKIHRNRSQTELRTSPQKYAQSEQQSCVSLIRFESDVHEIQIEHKLQNYEQVDKNVEGQCQKKKRRKKHNKGNNIHQQFKKTVYNQIINQQLTNFIDSLSIESNRIYESKAIAFQRVSFFIKNLFRDAETVLFGSNAVGLSLPTSDIDVMILNLPCKNKEEACQFLAQIGICINAMGWVVSCSTYLGAKVPLVKLEIDPSISYCKTKRKSDYVQVIDPYLSYYLDLKDHSKSCLIKVDITVCLQEGTRSSPSTELMRSWIIDNHNLQRIILIIKYILYLKGFNQNFKGGIGSYCLFVMVAAYFTEFNVQDEPEGDILLAIFKFYGQEFENQIKIISLQGKDKSCYMPLQSILNYSQISSQFLEQNLLKIIDPLSQKIMSSSCYQYNSIKSEWRRIRSEMLNLNNMIESQIEICFHNTAQMSKLLANKKQLDRWIHKYQHRSGFSIKNIINGQI